MRGGRRRGGARQASLFRLLSQDEQLSVASALTSPRDRAALCLALPPLGLAAIRTLDSYKGALFALAMQELGRGGISEALVRRYLRECRPSIEECELLSSLDSGILCVRHVLGTRITWRCVLLHVDNSSPPFTDWVLVRDEQADGWVRHYEGEKDAERMVRVEFPNGRVLHHEGERGARLACLCA